MALLDVSDILLDPDFADSFDVVRSTITINSGGIASKTETTQTVTGVITSGGGDLLERMAEGTIIKGSITIHTTFRLSDGSTGNGADEIVWQGNRYTVTTVNDYSHFGAGFVSANADLKPVNPQ